MGCTVSTSVSNSSPNKIDKGAELKFETGYPLTKDNDTDMTFTNQKYICLVMPGKSKKNYQLASFF